MKRGQRDEVAGTPLTPFTPARPAPGGTSTREERNMAREWSYRRLRAPDVGVQASSSFSSASSRRLRGKFFRRCVRGAHLNNHRQTKPKIRTVGTGDGQSNLL